MNKDSTGLGSAELRALYLDPKEAGVPWLLNPASYDVITGLQTASERTKSDECDPFALAADLQDFVVLLRERHFGLATGVVSGDNLDAWVGEWEDRLKAERPVTWGACLGTDMYRLRWLLGDNHLRAVGEDSELLRAADTRGGEAVLGRDNGPIVEEENIEGVLCIRIRQFGGRSSESERLILEWQQAHQRHFGHDRIILDLRSNPGGSDSFTLKWIADHARSNVDYPPNQLWHLDGKPLLNWNYVVEHESVAGPGSVPIRVLENKPSPNPDATLEIHDDVESLSASASPWRGQMLVLIDRGTASAAESTAWMLQQAFGAKLIGGRTGGFLTFGDLAPYLLPRSGLVVELATHWFGWRGVEMVGLPVDLELDPRTPLSDIACRFGAIYEDAVHPPGRADE